MCIVHPSKGGQHKLKSWLAPEYPFEAMFWKGLLSTGLAYQKIFPSKFTRLYYPHPSRYLVFPVCGTFNLLTIFSFVQNFNLIFLSLLRPQTEDTEATDGATSLVDSVLEAANLHDSAPAELDR